MNAALALAGSLLFVAFAGAPPPTAVPIEARVTGAWIARDGGPFQQMAFDYEEGERTFSSWLHDRPEFNGTWRLDGETITIEANDLTWTLRIVRIDDFRMDVLADDDTSPSTYVRP